MWPISTIRFVGPGSNHRAAFLAAENASRSHYRTVSTKGGKRHEVSAHHNAEAYLDAYLAAARIADDRNGPLFRSLDRERHLTARQLHRLEVLATPAPTCDVCRCRVIKRRARQAGLPHTTCCHTFRATGITTYLQNGGTIEHAQQIAAHESPRTTKLYDRTSDAISLDEIERILI